MRDAVIDRFLAPTPWAAWHREPLAGDASRRRYLRLRQSEKTVILMDAPPDSGEDTRPFVRIGRHLADLGLCPPSVLASDPVNGLLVIEDLGPQTVAHWLVHHPTDERALYAAATDVLIRLQGTPLPDGLTTLTPGLAAQMTDLLTEWHAPDTPRDIALAIRDELCRVIGAHGAGERGIALRDYHAENLIWRPDRSDTDRIGLLDFQDAVVAHPAYDLASLLRDPRRRVDDTTADQMIDRFIAGTRADPATFRAAFAVWAVQRNLRILGIFARLVHSDGKPRYARFVPLVRDYLRKDLDHPDLATLRALVLPVVASEAHNVA